MLKGIDVCEGKTRWDLLVLLLFWVDIENIKSFPSCLEIQVQKILKIQFLFQNFFKFSSDTKFSKSNLKSAAGFSHK